MKSSLFIHFRLKKQYFFHCLFSGFWVFLMVLLKSDFSRHWFKEESHDCDVRQMLKTWAIHMIRRKDCAVSSYNERSILDWRRRAYGEKK